MQTNRSPFWALGGAAFGFLLPFVGFACIAAVCLSSLLATSGLTATSPTSESSKQLSGPVSGPAVAVIDINGEIVSGSSASLGSSSYASTEDIVPLGTRASA